MPVYTIRHSPALHGEAQINTSKNAVLPILAAALLWPLSLPWLLAIHFSLCSLISSMWAWPVIQQYVVRPEDRDSSG